MTHRYVAKYVHAFAITFAALTLLAIPYITNRYLIFTPMIGFGVSWVSMMGVPFMIVVYSIPKERHGVYMSIVSMTIVIPMFIETVTFSWAYRTFLGANPSNAVIFTGIFLVIATSLTVMIRISNKPVGVSENA